MPIHFFVFKIRTIENGFVDPKRFLDFRETGPWSPAYFRPEPWSPKPLWDPEKQQNSSDSGSVWVTGYGSILKFAYILTSDVKFQKVLRGIAVNEFRDRSLERKKRITNPK